MDIPLTSLHECTLFLESQPPPLIAARVLHDLSLCRTGSGIPSLLVYCLPARADPIALEISKDAPDVPLSVARMRYSSIVANIKSYLATLQHTSLDGDAGSIPTHMVPSDDDYHSTLKVLRYLQLPQIRLKVDGSSGTDQIAAIVQSQLELGPQLRNTPLLTTGTTGTNKDKARQICYICRFKYTQPHRLYLRSLCHPCGEFNISSSALSLPANLDLRGKTAVVTGARVNLGYHTALRLLRCGARVVVSTRYPHDAEQRYRREPDASEWAARLHIMGADFRVAKDVFALVKAIVECLEEWGTGGSTGGTAIKLDILINNAAQTLTDSIEREEEQIRREWLLAPPDSDVREEEEDVGMMVEGPTSDTGNSLGVAGDGMVATTTGYVPRLRGGQFESARTLIENNPLRGQARQSSWVQRMAEIPYEDVISAHSINTFVPFILIRELMPLMRRDRHHHHHQQPQQDDMSVDSEERKPGPRKPTAYIINVSSREGLPERHIGNQPKDGQHVHTNMSKAALNMLTETEARKAWKGGRVAMNAVDPGYMSADPAWMKRVGRENEQPPLSWEDGVGRVLWAVAKGETENVPVWGKFLKHFVELIQGGEARRVGFSFEK